jgi:hypothetical protein
MRLFTKPGSLLLPKSSQKVAYTFNIFLAFILLSCILTDPMMGTFTWLNYKKSIVKKEVNKQIAEGINKDDLILLKFTKEEMHSKLRWENKREFEYNRRMYDIVEAKVEGEHIYYWCLPDHEETNLNRRLENLLDKALKKNSKIIKEITPLMSPFKSLYCLSSFNIELSISESLAKRFCLFSRVYSQIITQPPSPPPKFN